jgi:hypothetical protein
MLLIQNGSVSRRVPARTWPTGSVKLSATLRKRPSFRMARRMSGFPKATAALAAAARPASRRTCGVRGRTSSGVGSAAGTGTESVAASTNDSIGNEYTREGGKELFAGTAASRREAGV